MESRLVLTAFILVTGLFCLLIALLPYANGWHKLARAYRSTGAFEGRQWTNQWAVMRGGLAYNPTAPWSLTVGADARGLRLSVVLFSLPIGHEPLFIPWAHVTAKDVPARFSALAGVELRFAGAGDVPFRISTQLAERIAEEAGSRFRWGPGK